MCFVETNGRQCHDETAESPAVQTANEQQASDGGLLVSRKCEVGLLSERKILHVLLFQPFAESKQENCPCAICDTFLPPFSLRYPQTASPNRPANVNVTTTVCRQTATVSLTFVRHNQIQKLTSHDVLESSPFLATGVCRTLIPTQFNSVWTGELQLGVWTPFCLNILAATSYSLNIDIHLYYVRHNYCEPQTVGGFIWRKINSFGYVLAAAAFNPVLGFHFVRVRYWVSSWGKCGSGVWQDEIFKKEGKKTNNTRLHQRLLTKYLTKLPGLPSRLGSLRGSRVPAHLKRHKHSHVDTRPKPASSPSWHVISAHTRLKKRKEKKKTLYQRHGTRFL